MDGLRLAKPSWRGKRERKGFSKIKPIFVLKVKDYGLTSFNLNGVIETNRFNPFI